ncbi:hypothetical protein ACIP9X_16935 [Arthrobacter sp. NPDC093125]|uniref:hypothetical protein n=1 Tax=Arthrobacter sp. NPDC093125 TaxID=3363944 RepID=UPI00380002CC
MASHSDLGQARDNLAKWILGLGASGIVAVSLAAILWATDDGRPEMARLVFTSILPLFGTWVGTVLAFYYVRDNLDAATASTERILGLKPTTPVTDVMIPAGKIISFRLQPGTSAASVVLSDLYKSMVSAGVSRIPILENTGAVAYIVHKSTIDAYAAIQNTKPDSLSKTIQDLADDSVLFKKRIEAIGIVGPHAVIAEARRNMSSISDCQDIFVTAGGAPKDPVIGWLTNVVLAADV